MKEDEILSNERNVFVTVGSTLFDALIETVDREDFQNLLIRKGYTSLTIQIGKGNYIPKQKDGSNGTLRVHYFKFSPSLADYFKNASLVISHAGSGSIFESLRAGKPLIVVVNELLMDNHQLELATALASENYLFHSSPEKLLETLVKSNFSELLPYPVPNMKRITDSLDEFFGFS